MDWFLSVLHKRGIVKKSYHQKKCLFSKIIEFYTNIVKHISWSQQFTKLISSEAGCCTKQNLELVLPKKLFFSLFCCWHSKILVNIINRAVSDHWAEYWLPMCFRWNLKATRLLLGVEGSDWNLAGGSAVMLQNRPPNFILIRQL